jgi:hypothetical protein
MIKFFNKWEFVETYQYEHHVILTNGKDVVDYIGKRDLYRKKCFNGIYKFKYMEHY